MKLFPNKPPIVPDATYAEAYADLHEENRGLNKDNDKLRGTIARLTQDLAQEKADKAAMAAQVACEPEAMISLSVAVARRPGVEYEWIRRRLENQEIEGKKPNGRWFLRYSSLLRVKRATLG
jgi:hypothetical protein